MHARTELRTAACTMVIERQADTSLHVTIEGHDVGEFGALPMRCLEAFMPATGSVRLRIDARRARGAALQVSHDWAQWLAEHRGRLESVNMHVASAYVRVIADFVRRFAGLEELMRVEASGSALPR
ncbi:hypothetical protein [Lysobacter humi (ex Lee et al. 2017)]